MQVVTKANEHSLGYSPISAREKEQQLSLKAGNERSETSVMLYQCAAWSGPIETNFANSL